MKTILLAAVAVAVSACSRPPAPGEAVPAPQVISAASALTATQDTVLTITGPAMGDQAGASVALSADGTLAAVGVPRDDFPQTQLALAGSVRLFSRVAGAWAETATIRAPTPTMGAQFGLAISMSADGSRLLVGAPFEDGAAGSDVGAARVYLRTPTGWTLEGALLAPDLVALDYFGLGVALSRDGTRAFVGAVGDEVPGGPPNTGAVRVYVRNASGWNFEALLTASGGAPEDTFGMSVAPNADGSRVLVGARGDDTDAGLNVGTVRVFVRTGTVWTEEATLEAADAMPADNLGNAVALSDDGLLALVGASGDDTDAGVNSGTVRPFVRLGGAWVEQGAIVPPDSASANGFGAALALRGDGARAVIGAPLGAASDGVSRVFTLEAQGWMPDTALVVTPRAVGGMSGAALAMSADGEQLLVGLPGYSAPASGAGGAAVFSLVGLSTGFACTSASQCVTGACVDGFCCDRACGAAGAQCQGCAMARTGLPNGTCGVVVAGRACRPSRGPCDPGEVCDGFSSVCPGDVLSPMGQLCRAPSGPCDAPEVCSGVSPSCPNDGMRASGTVCQPANGPCDDPDLCDGVGHLCAPRYKPAGTVCNAAILGPCDAPDVCRGDGTECRPAYLSGVECRPSAGACDLAEVCFGSSPNCPPDQVLSSGIVCRSSRNVMCNPMESCDGVAAACPADVNLCVGDEVPMPMPMMCPEAPACPAPMPETPRAATGCFQIGPGGPAVAEVLLAALALISHRRRRSR